MWRNLACLAMVALLGGVQAKATGIEITVAGQANGVIAIDLFEDVAPRHVERITTLAERGAYDNVGFHRVIDGFMAQTGDVAFGVLNQDYRANQAGRGGSDLPDLQAEFSTIPFDAGIVGMARAANPNSANSQFFIMFAPGYFLNEQYTVVGKVTDGHAVVNAIKRGHSQSGAMMAGLPDRMVLVTVID